MSASSAASAVPLSPDRRGLFVWATNCQPPERAGVREALLLTVPDTPFVLALCMFWTQTVAGLALWVTHAGWAAAWLGADAVLQLLRLALHWRHARALRQHAVPPTAQLLAANLVWYASIGLGSMACVLDGDLRLMVLGSVLDVGFLGYIASRCAAFPRLGLPSIYLLAACFMAGLLQSPHHELTTIGWLIPFGGVAFHTLFGLNHQLLVGAMRSQQESRRLSRCDPLTGLPNRLELHERLSALCGPEHAAPQGTRCAVLCLDLDSFKPINDRHGHTAGDWVLKATAERLLGAVRSGDLVCRVGGDEFVIVLPAADAASATAAAQRVIAACTQPIDLGQAALVQVGVSIGIALAPHAPSNPDRLLTRADAALYAVKGSGKGQWALDALDADGAAAHAPLKAPRAAA